MTVRHWWNDKDRRKPKYSEITCPVPTLSTTNPKWIGLVLNRASAVKMPATSRLICGTGLN